MALPLAGGVTRPILAGLAAMAMLSLQLAYAHGPAEWIQRGGYKNALGELCCGERDCFELVRRRREGHAGGLFRRSAPSETVPFHEATPSPTGTYWRCTGAASASASSRRRAAPDRPSCGR